MWTDLDGAEPKQPVEHEVGETRVGIPDDARLSDQEYDRKKRGREREPKQIEERQHAPRELVGGRALGGQRVRNDARRLVRGGDRHGVEF
jgi:hypothetical protein